MNVAIARHLCNEVVWSHDVVPSYHDLGLACPVCKEPVVLKGGKFYHLVRGDVQDERCEKALEPMRDSLLYAAPTSKNARRKVYQKHFWNLLLENCQIPSWGNSPEYLGYIVSQVTENKTFVFNFGKHFELKQALINGFIIPVIEQANNFNLKTIKGYASQRIDEAGYPYLQQEIIKELIEFLTSKMSRPLFLKTFILSLYYVLDMEDAGLLKRVIILLGGSPPKTKEAFHKCFVGCLEILLIVLTSIDWVNIFCELETEPFGTLSLYSAE